MFGLVFRVLNIKVAGIVKSLSLVLSGVSSLK